MLYILVALQALCIYTYSDLNLLFLFEWILIFLHMDLFVFCPALSWKLLQELGFSHD